MEIISIGQFSSTEFRIDLWPQRWLFGLICVLFTCPIRPHGSQVAPARIVIERSAGSKSKACYGLPFGFGNRKLVIKRAQNEFHKELHADVFHSSCEFFGSFSTTLFSGICSPGAIERRKRFKGTLVSFLA